MSAPDSPHTAPMPADGEQDPSPETLRTLIAELREERNIFAAGPVVVFKWLPEPGWPVPYCSPNIRPLWGYPPEDLIQGRIAFADLIHPDDLPRIRDEVYRHLANGLSYYEQEYRVRHANGHYASHYDFTAVERNAHGEVVGLRGYLLNNDEQRMLREELERTNQTMHETVFRLQKVESELRMLHGMNKRLLECESIDAIHTTIAGLAEVFFPGVSGRIAYRQTGGGLASAITWGNLPAAYCLDKCNTLDRIHRQPIQFISPERSNCRRQREGICIPICVPGRPNGILTLVFAEDEASGRVERNCQLAEMMGEGLQLALSNLALHESLKMQATHDGLTNLFNRRYLDETLPREIHLALRNGTPLAVAVLDLDFFKKINDGYGHDAGDEVLIQTARLLAESLRKSDMAVRYGGEEFVAVLLDASNEDALLCLERMAQSLQSLEIRFQGRPMPPVTVSGGIANISQGYPQADDLVRAADQALYRAKQSGRNRILIAEPAKPKVGN